MDYYDVPEEIDPYADMYKVIIKNLALDQCKHNFYRASKIPEGTYVYRLMSINLVRIVEFPKQMQRKCHFSKTVFLRFLLTKIVVYSLAPKHQSKLALCFRNI